MSASLSPLKMKLDSPVDNWLGNTYVIIGQCPLTTRENEEATIMATREQIEATYNYMDEVFRVSLGEHGDLTCALYDGDFSKTLEQAQKDKHDYILDAIHFKAGSRVLDIGCGWGPMLKAVTERGGHAIGLTLSTRQADTCKRGGLEAYVQEWKEISRATFGPFDGIVSVGAFEHFCSLEEYLAG